jgi:hypothetical protein
MGPILSVFWGVSHFGSSYCQDRQLSYGRNATHNMAEARTYAEIRRTENISLNRGKSMKLATQLAAFVLLMSTTSFAAGNWRGYLVDSKCYESATTNGKYLTSVNRDMDLSIKLCVPSAKTKSFALVQPDWKMIKFDPDGNSKAAKLFVVIIEQQRYWVTITGEMDESILKVGAISMAKQDEVSLR